jgi:peroxiredoxin
MTETSAPAHSSAMRRAIMGLTALTCAGAGGWLAWRRLAPGPAADSATLLLRSMTLPDAQGSPYALSATASKTVVLNFWATWCPPCVEEMPELATLHQEISARNGLVVGIGIDSASNIAQFASKHQFPYPLLVGGAGATELSRQMGNASGALPFTVIIDARGAIAHQILGRIKLPQLRTRVLDLLG